ncbi:hypothetical protein DL95DRAFT_477829 [Leptodontidium sp. 2 PMI_412]|nr:hypothetical protein BKA61DRAFT_686660 [Leptodontidium sp. MPI-SDFR-AT-0119]KAH9209180.1 hypothetical protein DL95DRAFT_477829 [Leptodontidium sp. 2 PMI_412]
MRYKAWNYQKQSIEKKKTCPRQATSDKKLCVGLPPQSPPCKYTHPVAKVVMAICEELIKAPSTSGNRPRLRIWDDSTEHPGACSDDKLVIHINIGALVDCKTAGQVAWVLGHEIGHALARHAHESHFYECAEAYTETLNSSSKQKSVDACCSHARALEAAENAKSLGYTDKLSIRRYQEFEADYIGIVIAAEAGFDPDHAIGVLKAHHLRYALYECLREAEDDHPTVYTPTSPLSEDTAETDSSNPDPNPNFSTTAFPQQSTSEEAHIISRQKPCRIVRVQVAERLRRDVEKYSK